MIRRCFSLARSQAFAIALLITAPITSSLAQQSNDPSPAKPGLNSSVIKLINGKPLEACELADPSPLRVYVYDLPYKFHFGLFVSKDVEKLPIQPPEPMSFPYRRKRDGTVSGRGFEHSAEGFITYDLLFPPKTTSSSTTQRNEVLRVTNADEADIFFIPFLASLSFNRFSTEGMHSALAGIDRNLQQQLMQMLNESEWWQRSGGHDHVIGMVQPNALRFVKAKMASAIFLVADFGRTPQSLSRLSKDIVVPYNHMLPTYSEAPEDGDKSWERRTTLLYFQGTVKRKNEGYIRKLMFNMLRNESDVHFADSRADAEGIKSATEGMRSSKFCLHAAGDTPSSCRLFDAIVNHCVPLIVSNKLELPFETTLDYSDFSIFLSHEEALREGHLLELLRGMSKVEWTRRWRRLLEVQGMFKFQIPSQKGDAVSNIWRDIRYRLPRVRAGVHQYQRQLMAKEMWN